MSDKKNLMFVECECSSKSHGAVITERIFDWGDFKDVDLYLETQMTPYLSFWKRIWYSFKFIFNLEQCNLMDGHWTNCIVSRDDAEKLRNLIDEYIHDYDEEENRRRQAKEEKKNA